MRTESKTQRVTARLALVVGAAWMAALPAFAEEHGGSAGGPFEGNFGVALWTLIIFGIVVFVLGKFAWGPILGGLQAREKYIRESIEAAKRDREAAEARLKEYSDKLVGARAPRPRRSSKRRAGTPRRSSGASRKRPRRRPIARSSAPGVRSRSPRRPASRSSTSSPPSSPPRLRARSSSARSSRPITSA